MNDERTLLSSERNSLVNIMDKTRYHRSRTDRKITELLRSNYTVRIRNVIRTVEWMQYYGLYSPVYNVLYSPFVTVYGFPPVVP